MSVTNPNTNVDALASLCKLDFTEIEKSKISAEFSKILDFVSVIQQAHTEHDDQKDQQKKVIQANLSTQNNIVREDQVKAGLSREITQKLAPKFVSGHIVVPAVINH